MSRKITLKTGFDSQKLVWRKQELDAALRRYNEARAELDLKPVVVGTPRVKDIPQESDSDK